MFGPSRRELSRQLERERMRNQQREAELVNQILYLSGHMWAPPPSPPLEDEERPDEPVYQSALSGLPPGYEE